jgi:hypothetical protein
MQTLIELLAPFLVPVLSAVLGMAIAWVLKKVGITDPVIVAKATEIAVLGVTKAEQVARSNADKIPAPAKMRSALAIMERLANENPQVKDYIIAKGAELAEAVLRSSLTPAHMTPKVK